MSSWGDSWGDSWGVSWGGGTPVPPSPVVPARTVVWGKRIEPDEWLDDMERAAVGVAVMMLGDNR